MSQTGYVGQGNAPTQRDKSAVRILNVKVKVFRTVVTPCLKEEGEEENTPVALS